MRGNFQGWLHGPKLLAAGGEIEKGGTFLKKCRTFSEKGGTFPEKAGLFLKLSARRGIFRRALACVPRQHMCKLRLVQ